RPEIINFLIDNLLIDQYLLQSNVQVEPKEVEARMEQIRADIKKLVESKPGQTYESLLKDLLLTEEELKVQIAADLRWHKYATQQASGKALREFFAANKDIFDGSMVRARHILLTPAAGDAQAADKAKAELAQIKQQIEQQVTAGLAKVPAGGDALEREKARA